LDGNEKNKLSIKSKPFNTEVKNPFLTAEYGSPIENIVLTEIKI